MTHPFRTLITLFAALGLTGATAVPAHADDDDDDNVRQGVVLGLDAGPNFVVVSDDVSDESVGVGFAFRLGYRFAMDLFEVEPELKLGLESPGTPNAFRAMGGLRLGLGTVVSPVAFAHAGALAGDLEGLAWDAGGGVRFNFDRLSFGAAVAYNQAETQVLALPGLEVDRQWEWVSVNGTLTITL